MVQIYVEICCREVSLTNICNGDVFHCEPRGLKLGLYVIYRMVCSFVVSVSGASSTVNFGETSKTNECENTRLRDGAGPFL